MPIPNTNLKSGMFFNCSVGRPRLWQDPQSSLASQPVEQNLWIFVSKKFLFNRKACLKKKKNKVERNRVKHPLSASGSHTRVHEFIHTKAWTQTQTHLYEVLVKAKPQQQKTDRWFAQTGRQGRKLIVWKHKGAFRQMEISHCLIVATITWLYSCQNSNYITSWKMLFAHCLDKMGT